MPVPAPKNAHKAWEGHIYAAWEWDQELYDGSHATFECLTRPDSTTVIAFLDPQTVLLTKQEQPGKGTFMDFSGGRVDPGEDALQASQREFEEETGYAADPEDWFLWKRHERLGYVRYVETLYLARNIKKINTGHVDPGERIEVVPTKWDEVVELCLADRLRQSAVMHAVLCMQFDPEQRQRLDTWLGRV